MTGYIEEQAGADNAGKWDIATVPGGGGNWGGSFLAVPDAEQAPGAGDRAGQVPDQRRRPARRVRGGRQPAVEPDAVRRPGASRTRRTRTSATRRSARSSSPVRATSKPVYLGAKNQPVRDAVENALRSVENGEVSADDGWARRRRGRPEAAARLRPDASDGARGSPRRPGSTVRITPHRLSRRAEETAEHATDLRAPPPPPRRGAHPRRDSASPLRVRLAVLPPVRGLRAVPARATRPGSPCTTGACSVDAHLARARQLHRAARRRRTSGTPWSTPSASSSLATVPQLLLALVLAQHAQPAAAGADVLADGRPAPNITSVAAVGIIFTLMFARDFGLVNWVLGPCRRRPDRLAGPPVVVLAGDLGRWSTGAGPATTR